MAQFNGDLLDRVVDIPVEPWTELDFRRVAAKAGEFLVASRLTQRGYMVALQWGTTIGYDILVFDKKDDVAYLEVKATASHPQKWLLQKKYATPNEDAIAADW